MFRHFTHFGMDRVAAVALGTLVVPPLAAQNPSSTVVIYGQVADAVSLEPLDGALVMSGDSATWAFADSLGNFGISLNSTPPYVMRAEQFGYVPTDFELPEGSSERMHILVLNPDPIQIEGITVVEESALTALTERMEGRRSAYSGSVSFRDREDILRTGAGSALDLVRGMYSAYECGLGGLCRSARGRTGQILICIDEQRAMAPIAELSGISVENLASSEFYLPTVGTGPSRGPDDLASRAPTYPAGQLRVYTRQWMVSTAGRGVGVWPAEFGCG